MDETQNEKRKKQGGIRECRPSIFMDEIPKDLIKYYVLDEKEEEERIDDMFAKLKSKFKDQEEVKNIDEI